LVGASSGGDAYATDLLQHALAAVPESHPDRPATLSNLAAIMRGRGHA
jgi:hypothetical protein